MTTQFSARVCEFALAIPAGRVTTYGHLAKAAGGGAQAARSITSILSKYPNQAAIPYHRIVYANGRIWTNEAHHQNRLKLFKTEGITLTPAGYVADFEEVLWNPQEIT